MECSEPGAIRDEELLAYSAGEKVRPAVVEHLAHCKRCAAQLAAYQRMELRLSEKLYRWDCPPSQTLGEYQLGLLDQQQAALVKNHLRTCLHCAAEAATLTEFLAHDPWLVEQAQPSPQRSTVQPSSLNNHLSTERVKRTDQRNALQLIGFVTRKGATLEALQGMPVQLSSPSHVVFTQQIDELGNFIFSELAPATYSLELHFADCIIVIDQLPVTAQD
jgi:hypothetical protein